MQVAKRLETVNEYYFSTKLREIETLRTQGKPIINLGIGSPDLPPAPAVLTALTNAAAQPQNHAYQGYKGNQILRQAIANFYNAHYNVALNPNTDILPLLGSKEGIMHICMSYFEQGDYVLIPNPGYPTYSSALALTGATAISYNLTAETNYQLPIAAIEAEIINKKVKGIFINSPHMPTGSELLNNNVEALIEICIKHNVLIIHDNPYSFILNNNPKSLLGLQHANQVMIELNSLSKSHNMAGWRVGMACGKQAFIDTILRFKSNMDSGMFLPVQLAAAEALKLNTDWFNALNKIYEQRRLIAYQIFDALKVAYHKNQIGMFLWGQVTNAKDGYTLSDEILYTKNVFITPGGIFGSNGNNYIRLSLCSNQTTLQQALIQITH